jgi:hypothetical protein
VIECARLFGGEAIAMKSKEADEFRRIALVTKVERAEEHILNYREGISFFRRRLNTFYQLLGHTAERLGEPEPKEPQ